MKNKQTNPKMFKSGQAVVLLGRTEQEREIYLFENPEKFVECLRKSEKVSFENNQEFMQSVSRALGKNDAIHVNTHNEEAFVESLIRYGVCFPAVLN